MKKYFSVFFATVIALAVFASCQKNDGDDTSAGNDDPIVKEQVTITVSIPKEGLTKVAFTEEDSNPGGDPKMRLTKLSWEETDHITINGNSFGVKAGSISGDGLTATFTGDDPGASPYDIVLNSNMPGSTAEQTQPADGDAGNLGYNVSITGANAYQNIQFTSDWAESHGDATFAVSSVLQLRAKLPDAVASAVKKVIFKASNSDAFGTGVNKITVTLTTPGTAGSDKILDVYAALPAGVDVTLAADMDLLVQFQCHANNEYNKYTAYRKIASGKHFVWPGHTQYLGLDCSNIESFANASTTNIGQSTNPYLIGDKYQLQAMHTLAVAGTKKYFRLVDDVDLNNESWTPINVPSPYDIAIDFDGNGNTISKLSSSGKYASFAGVLNGDIYDVTFTNATISSTQAKAGVVAAFVGSSSGSVSGSCHGITVQNSSVTNTAIHAGGFAGIADNLSAPLDDCHVVNTTVTGLGGDNTDSRAGGLLGELKAGFTCKNSTAEGVTVSGSKNVGGLIGVAYGTVQDCWSSGGVSSPNTTGNSDIGLGGLVGYFETGTITKCHSSVTIDQTTNGRDIGGLVGKMLAGTIEKSYATGNVSGIQRNVGGLVGLVTLTSGTATISNCYCIGTVNGTGGYSGGFLGLHEKGTANITNSYSTSAVTGSFGLGGIVGCIGSADMTVGECAAWNSAITPSSSGSESWSSGAVVGITFPTCTLTDNYRNPSMSLTAYWVPAADYNHANVSSSHPLVKQNGVETTATSTAKGQDGYPQFPYHGKVETGKTLSQLASTTLGWSGDVWDFSGPLPLLK